MTSQAPAIVRESVLRQFRRLLSRLLPLRYLLLRSSTAGAAVVSGLVQTFVFARVLTPQEFSIFILIGTLGISLWLFDLGAAKILFVRQRARYLGQRPDEHVAAQSTAVVLLYGLMVLAGALLCFAFMASRPTVSLWQAAQFGLFFSFSALNLVWFPLRNVSTAVDEFIYFETLEAIRRVGHIGVMLALLVGLPMPAFLILANFLWFVLLAACSIHLVRKSALAPRLARMGNELLAFWRVNRAEVLRSGNYAIGELIVYNFPYVVVPAVFGLGAPTIILDTVFKIFRGATLIFAAGLEPLVPQQTRAYAARDPHALNRATLTAAILCAIPTAVLCVILLLAGDRLFALLLEKAATIPPQATIILVVLLFANLIKNTATCLLQHTGFFRELARLGTLTGATIILATGLAVVFRFDFVAFLSVFAVAYVCGAVVAGLLALRGPIRHAAEPH
jgi:O-antigen/teichoic acid export membrane protein